MPFTLSHSFFSVLFECCAFIHIATASQVLKKHEDEFFKVVDAKLNLHFLKRKNVITEDLKTQIESSNSANAKEILFEHLKCHADVAALRMYFEMAEAADGFPNMQKLGKKVLNDLPPEGLLG